MYWINGIPQQCLPLADRAFQFGDGFFTTIRLKNGRVSLLSLHLERLILAAKRLLFNPLDITSLQSEIFTAAATSCNGLLKIIISRGSSAQGYRFNDYSTTPLRIICHSVIPEYYSTWRRDGIKLIKSSVRLARNPLLAGIKHLNRLEQVLISLNIKHDSHNEEALVLDTDGYLVECCSANIFWRRGRKVFTPLLNYAGVDGVMRKWVMTLLPKLDFHLQEVMTGPEDLQQADEVFITNTLLPVVSVNTIGQHNYSDRTLSKLLMPYCFSA